jgi:hypothetical protein
MVSSPSRTHLHLPLLTPHAVPFYSRMHEVKGLQAVRRYDVLATAPDGAYDRTTALATRLFNVPIAIVSIVDAGRVWFKFHQCDQIQPGRGERKSWRAPAQPRADPLSIRQKLQLSVSQ